MTDKIKAVVVGAGIIGESHLEGIQWAENVELAGIVDTDSERAQNAVERFGGKVYPEYAAALEDAGVDAVHICTPHSLHLEQVLAAFAAKKHVMVEKPMALTLADCEEMLAASKAAGKILMVGHVLRYHAVNQIARTLIKEGKIGTPTHQIRRRYSFFHPTRTTRYAAWYADPKVAGGAVLYNFGPHEYDLQHWYIDSPVVRVYAQGSQGSAFYPGQCDSYSAVLTHANGAVSCVSQSISAREPAADQQIVGSEGSLSIAKGQLTLNGEPYPFTVPEGNGMGLQVREFAASCLSGDEPDASGRSVLHTMAIIEAVQTSAAEGRIVEL